MADLMNKYRPRIFEEVVGQSFVKKVLTKHIRQDEFMSSYMFEGPYGSGKCLEGSTLVYPQDEVVEIAKLWNRFVRQGQQIRLDSPGEYMEVDLQLGGLAGPVRARYFYRERETCYRIYLENGLVLGGSGNHSVRSLSEGLFKWKRLGSLKVGHVLLTASAQTECGRKFKTCQLDRIIRTVRDWRLTDKLDPESLVEMNNRSLRYIVGKLLTELGSRIDFGTNVKFAEILQVRALDAGVPLNRNKEVIVYPKEIESLFLGLERHNFDYFKYGMERRLEMIWDNDLIYSLGQDLSILLKQFPSESHVWQYIEKTLRRAIQTRGVLKRILEIVTPHINRNRSRLDWPVDIWDRYKTLTQVIDRKYYLQKVAEIEVVGKRWLYDYTVPEERSFKSGAMFSHNTTLARIFSRAILCKHKINGVDPCNNCSTCKDHLAQRSPDVFEINAADHNSIEDVRRIKEQIGQKSWSGNKKIYLLDEAHDLSAAAWDALLKITEEAGIDMKTIFMFCTTEKDKIPKTIISRSRKLPVSIPREEEACQFLERIAKAEGIIHDERALVLIVKMTGGHLRDAVKELSVLADLGIEKFEDVLRHLGLDVKKDLLQILISLKVSPKDALEIVFTKLAHRMSYYEIMERLKQILTEVMMKVLGLDFIRLIWIGDEDESIANKISQVYGSEMNRIIDFIFSRVRQDYSPHEMVLDFIVMNQILNNKVEYAPRVKAGRVESSDQVQLEEGVSSEQVQDLKKKLKDVNFLYGLARRKPRQERQKRETTEIDISEDQLLSDLGLGDE